MADTPPSFDSFQARHCRQAGIPLDHLAAEGRRLLVIGSGGHAAVLLDIVQRHGGVDLAGCADADPDRIGAEVIPGCKVVAHQEDVPREYPPATTALLIAIGDDATRATLASQYTDAGYAFAVAVHPSADIGAGSHIGAGVTVMPRAVIGPRCVIGDHAIINTAASVDHDCRVGAASHIAPGVHMGGGASVGGQSLIGIGASINKLVRVGDRALVAVGCSVIRDVEDDQKITPARIGRNWW